MEQRCGYALAELFPEEPGLQDMTSSMYPPISPLKKTPRRRRRPVIRPYPSSSGERHPCGDYKYTPGWRQAEIARLAAHPMFPDLQKVVRSECSKTSLPMTLISQCGDSTPIVVSPGYEMASLHGRFLSLQPLVPPAYQGQLLELHQFYKSQALQLEEERARSLRAGNPLLYRTITGMFEERQRQLTSRVSASLDVLCRQLHIGQPLDQGQTLGIVDQGQVVVQVKQQSPAVTSAGVKVKKGTPGVNPKAVMVMSKWYQRHSKNPYPSVAEVREIAVRAGVHEEMVNKWFVYKRKRCGIQKSPARKRSGRV